MIVFMHSTFMILPRQHRASSLYYECYMYRIKHNLCSIRCIWLHWNHLIILLENDREFFIESHLKWNHLYQSCKFGRIYTHICLRQQFKLTWEPYELGGSRLRTDRSADFMTVETFSNSINWNSYFSSLKFISMVPFCKKLYPFYSSLDLIIHIFLRFYFKSIRRTKIYNFRSS